MGKRTTHWGRALGLLAVAVVTTVIACGDKKGGLIVAVSTDMKAPKDVSAVSLSVSTNGTLKFSAIGRVTPQGDVLLPATLAIAQPDDKDATVRVRVIAFQDRRARVLRDVRTTVPHDGRIALLRIPLSFVNDGSVIGTLPAEVALPPIKAPDGSGGGTVDALDPDIYRPNCPSPDQTWIDGECRDAALDSSALPEYSDEQVFGAGGAAGDTSKSCFDVARCFGKPLQVVERAEGGEGRGLVLDRGACTIALGATDPATLNLAIVTPETGECIRSGACYIPLDRGPSWNPENGTAKLAPVVCKLLGKGFRIEASTSCPSKVESSPICVAAPGSPCVGAGCVAGDGGPAEGGKDGSALDCRGDDAGCTTSFECCSQDCDPTTRRCSKPVWSSPGGTVSTRTTCRQAGADCTRSTDCCGLSCAGGKCSAAICTGDAKPCSVNAECCSGSCTPDGKGGGLCGSLSATCRTSGNACGVDMDCCSRLCRGGVCNIAPSFCTQTGDLCFDASECCGGICTQSAGNVAGLCGAPGAGGPAGPGCALAGQLCAAEGKCGECCSRLCEKTFPFGRTACVLPTGCRPISDLCATDDDCCGSATVPTGGPVGTVTCAKTGGAATGRCTNGVACLAAGGTCRTPALACSASANCCVGNALQKPDACLEDANGIPRCVTDLAIKTDCAGAGRTGQACASSADCCGLPCIAHACQAACSNASAQCTSDADCCKGLPCVSAPGSQQGTCGKVIASCSLAGQQCTVGTDCCDGVPCTNGRCHVP